VTVQALEPTTANNTISNSKSAAICAIQKGGLFYMNKWVDYRLALGFKTIYIYDNYNPCSGLLE
jgi:hypothetical protein